MKVEMPRRTVEDRLSEHNKLEELTLERLGRFIHYCFKGQAQPGAARELMDGLGFMSMLLKRYGVAPAYEREKTWEYMVTQLGGYTIGGIGDHFNEIGAQGWELVGPMPHTSHVFIWKKAKYS